jgi:hypothetical protein
LPKSTDGQPNYRTLIHSHDYQHVYDELEKEPRIEEVIRGLTWGISENGEEFDLIPTQPGVRMAKSDSVVTNVGTLPVIRIFFRILDDHQIELLAMHKQESSEDPDLP